MIIPGYWSNCYGTDKAFSNELTVCWGADPQTHAYSGSTFI